MKRRNEHSEEKLPPHKRDTEQEILDGIESFQKMLSRYPIRRQKSGSNTLANKALGKVYGKVKKQFNKNIRMPLDQAEIM